MFGSCSALGRNLHRNWITIWRYWWKPRFRLILKDGIFCHCNGKTCYFSDVSQISSAVSSRYYGSMKNTQKSIWRKHNFFSDNQQMFWSWQNFTFTIFVLHPTTPLIFSSVWMCSVIVHFWVVIIFSLKMHSTSRFLSITCCSKLLFRFIVLKRKDAINNINTELRTKHLLNCLKKLLL